MALTHKKAGKNNLDFITKKMRDFNARSKIICGKKSMQFEFSRVNWIEMNFQSFLMFFYVLAPKVTFSASFFIIHGLLKLRFQVNKMRMYVFFSRGHLWHSVVQDGWKIASVLFWALQFWNPITFEQHFKVKLSLGFRRFFNEFVDFSSFYKVNRIDIRTLEK